MGEYRVTFGQQYPREPHPTLALAHRDGWVAILAPDEGQARAEAHRLLTERWSMIYAPGEDGYPTTEHYPLGCLLTVQAPTQGAVHLLTGPMPDHRPTTGADGYDAERLGGHLLVHVWPDGTGEVAWRGYPSDTWWPPSRLEPAP